MRINIEPRTGNTALKLGHKVVVLKIKRLRRIRPKPVNSTKLLNELAITNLLKWLYGIRCVNLLHRAWLKFLTLCGIQFPFKQLIKTGFTVANS